MGFGSFFKKVKKTVKSVVKVAAPIAGIALAPFTGGASLAVAGAISSGIGAYEANKQAKRQEAAAQGAVAQQIQLQQEQIDRFDKLIDKLPDQQREYLEDISASYAENRMMLEEAKSSQDAQAIANYEALNDIIESTLAAEMTAIGENHEDYINTLNVFSDDMVGLVRSDAEANEGLKQQFRDTSDQAITKLKDASGLVTQRMEAIEKSGGLPDGADAIISNMRQGIADVHRQVKDLDAATGKGGSASRKSAVALEGLKQVGETMAGLKQQGTQELMQLVGVQAQLTGQLTDTAAQKTIVGKHTEGAEIAAAKAPFIQEALTAEGTRGARELTAIGNSNVAMRTNQASLGDTQLAQQREYEANRLALNQGEAAAKLGVKERSQSLALNMTAKTGTAVQSMSDVLGAQANNYSNQASASRAQANESMASAMSVIGGGFAGQQQGIGFMQGVNQFALGLPAPAKQTPSTQVSPFVGAPSFPSYSRPAGTQGPTPYGQVGVTPYFGS